MEINSAFAVPPITQRKRIPMRTIRALAKHIAEKFQPEEIILFGSHAYGKPQPWSDVDLLVVMDTPKGELETALEIKKSIFPVLFSVDILVRSRDVIEKRKSLNDWFLLEITQKGKTLYARPDK
jgi:predicted nucleotidyltransferase